MGKIITKEDEVEIEEVIKDKMEEENLEDRTKVLVIKMSPEDNLKDTTDLSQEISTSPSPTEENLDPNPTKDNPALNQNKTAETKVNQKRE